MCANLFKPIDTSSCQSGQRLFQARRRAGIKVRMLAHPRPPRPTYTCIEKSAILFTCCSRGTRAEEPVKQRRGASIIWAGGRMQTRQGGGKIALGPFSGHQSVVCYTCGSGGKPVCWVVFADVCTKGISFLVQLVYQLSNSIYKMRVNPNIPILN